MSRFTPATEAALIAAGWFPERRVEWNRMCDWAIIKWNNDHFSGREGYLPAGYSKISPIAWQVLEEFGGLSIKHGMGEHPFDIDPLMVPDCASVGRGLEGYVWDIGVDVFPLGMIQAIPTDSVRQKNQIIAISGDGRVFALGYPSFLLGNSFDEALEKIVMGESGKEIEVDEEAQNGHMITAIEWKIMQRDLRLINGELPEEPNVTVHSATTSVYGIRDWEAETAFLTRAFGITQPCAFVGSRHRKTLRPIINNRSLNDQFPLLGDGFALGITYDWRSRQLHLKNVSHDLPYFNDITVYARWNDDIRASKWHRREDAKKRIIIAKGLFHLARGLCRLGLMTPEIEAELGLEITQHEKLEWQLEFEAKDSA